MGSKRVYLTEKPSVAKALAEYFGVDKREQGYFRVKGGDIVTHAIGHLVEQAPPDRYLPEALRGKFFAKEALPLIPDEWIKEPKPDLDEKRRPRIDKSGKPIPIPQLAIVTRLLKDADIVVNAGDIDREGQYLADELIEWAGIPPEGSRKPVERILITSLDSNSLKRAINAPRRSNGEPEFVNRRLAGECRSNSDWLVGMNGSRANSIAARTVVPIGRVRTPVVQMVVVRTLARRNFVKQDYFVPIITVDGFDLVWQGRKDGGDMRGIDEFGRIIDKAVADAIVKRILAGGDVAITRADVEEKHKSAPLPFSGSALQSEMGRKFGLTAKTVAKIAQALYEKHKVISYIGTDSRHLPKSQHAEAPDVLKGIAPVLAGLTAKGNLNQVSPCWNDDKVSAHHAIIPTGVLPAKGALSADEEKVFEAICRRYLSQFYPDYRYHSILVEADADFDEFRSEKTETIDPGWHVSEGTKPSADEEGESVKREKHANAARPG